MDEIEQVEVDNTNDDTLIEDTVEAEPETPKKEFTLEQKLARVSRMKAKLEKELGIETKTEPVKQKGNPGELDETQTLFLAVKGIESDKEIGLVEKWRTESGKTVKEIVASKIFQAELKELRDEEEVKNATPSATKRGGNQTNDLAAAIAKFEATNVLPDNFELRSAVVNAIAERSSVNKPSWHK